jgi:hypothetical protein
MRPIVRGELQVLSKEEPGFRQGGPLEFKAAYPIIFAALECAFGMMPSNSRVAEQAHGGMRDGLRDGVSLLSIDMMRAYLMNDVYNSREERRDCVRKREATAGTTKSRKTSIKHDEFKVEQVMSGVQLLASDAKYEAHEVARLPPLVRKEIGVKKIQKKGILHKDKEVQLLKTESFDAKHARRTAVPLTIDLFKEKAKSTAVGNDSTWENPEIVLRIADLERLASTVFWRGLKVRDKFTTVLKVVLPYL